MPEGFSITAIVALGSVLVLSAILARAATSDSDAGAPRAHAAPVLATVDSRAAIAVPRSFLGLSIEYPALASYEQHSATLTRVLSLLRARGDGPLTLRIGGDSADRTFWDRPGSSLPSWALTLTPAFLRHTGALVRRSGVRVIADLNLVTGSPTAAADWAQAVERGLPRGSVAGFEIGNEPDIYSHRDWLANTSPTGLSARLLPRHLTSSSYDEDFRDWGQAVSAVAPGVPLDGPALANPAIDRGWISNLLSRPHAGLRAVTAHIYPLSSCTRRGSQRYPTIARLLGPAATDVARSVKSAGGAAHRAGLAFRVSELNSVTCGGLAGVSNSFASALWAPQAMFELLRARVDGVNVHIRAGTINAAFALGRGGLTARPLLYGLILFARALGPDAELLHIPLHGRHPSRLEAWAVSVRGAVHVVIINPTEHAAQVALRLPSEAPATVQRLLAPALRSTTGVTLDGQRLGTDGRWLGRRAGETIVPSGHRYALTVPGASAALIAAPSVIHTTLKGADRV